MLIRSSAAAEHVQHLLASQSGYAVGDMRVVAVEIVGPAGPVALSRICWRERSVQTLGPALSKDLSTSTRVVLQTRICIIFPGPIYSCCQHSPLRQRIVGRRPYLHPHPHPHPRHRRLRIRR